MDQLLSTTVNYLHKQANLPDEDFLEPWNAKISFKQLDEEQPLNLPYLDLVNGMFSIFNTLQ